MPVPQLQHPEQLAALSGYYSAIAAGFSGLTSLFALILAIYTTYHQKRQARLVVKPLPVIHLLTADYLIDLSIYNGGLGPLIINDVKYHKNGKYIDKIFEPDYWNVRGFQGGVVENHSFAGGVLQAQGSMNILRIEVDKSDTTQIINMIAIGSRINEIQVEVMYSDLYNSKFKPKLRTLEISRL